MSAEPVSVVTTLSAPSRQASDVRASGSPRRRRDRLRRLRHVHHALGQHEARAERLARPVDDRVPVSAPGARPGPRARGADRTGDRSRDICSISAATGAGAGATPSMIELASRVSGIAAGSITVLLRVPFRGDRLRQRPRRRGKRAAAPASAPACRRAAPESRRVALAHRRRLVEPRPQIAAAWCAAPTPSGRTAGSRKSPRKCRASVSRRVCDLRSTCCERNCATQQAVATDAP